MTERAARYMSALDAASYMGVSRRTFFMYVRKNVPHVQIGARVLFDVADLDRWIETNKRVPAGGDVAADMAIGEVAGFTVNRRREMREHLKNFTPESTPKPTGLARARLKELRAKGKP